MNLPQDIVTDDPQELALRQRLARRQFYLCLTERTEREGDAMANLKPLMSAHLAWIAGLEASGVAFAAGPFRDHQDPSYWNGDGMFILRADSRRQRRPSPTLAPSMPAVCGATRSFRGG